MTALAAYCSDSELVIAMDTLASYPDKSPFKPVTKIIPLLHIHSVICPLGHLQLAHSLFLFIEERIICYDIDNLILHLRQNVNSFFQWTSDIWKTPLLGTVYLFGFSLSDKIYKGFAFRSSGNTATIDELPHGFIAKPHHGVIDEDSLEPLIPFNLNDIPSSLASAVLKMRNVDRSRPVQDRVGIGCQIQIAILDNRGYTITTVEMEDYKTTYNECCANLSNRHI